MNAPLRLLLVILLTGMPGCTTSTGEKRKVTRSQISSLKTVGVFAKADKPFQVRFSRDEAGSTGAMVGALTFGLSGVVVGSTIEAGAKAAADNKKTKSLGQAREFDGPKVLQQEVSRRLSGSGLFNSVVELPTNKVTSASHADAALLLNLREWGLRRQQAGGTNELLQVGLELNVRLVRPDGTALWERDDFYLDGNATSLQEFKDTPGLLSDRVSAALKTYAGRVVNELRFLE